MTKVPAKVSAFVRGDQDELSNQVIPLLIYLGLLHQGVCLLVGWLLNIPATC